MVMLESTNSARLRKKLRRGAQETKSAHDFMDGFEIWKPSRPANQWDNGTSVETLALLTSNTGKLYANGPGGPMTNEDVVFVESAYRFRTYTSVVEGFHAPGDGTPDVTGMFLVVNRSRIFVIDNAKPEDDEDWLIDLYLTEMVGKPIPKLPEVEP